MRIKLLFIFTVLLVSSPCLAQPSSPELERLKKEILTAIGVPHADSPDECAAIGFGIKPCGGPISYLIYSKKVTDQHKLEDLIDQFNTLSKKLSEGMVSDCMAVMPPKVALIDGKCRASGI